MINMNKKAQKQMQQLKQEYEHIPIPPQAKTRIQAGIAQAKQEKKKINITRIFRNTGTTAAATLLAITALTNISPSIAYAMDSIPVIGAISKVVTFRTYVDKKENMEADLKLPIISEENTSNIGISANQSIEAYANELIASYEKEVTQLEGNGHYAIHSNYKVVTDNDQYLCIRIDTTIIMASDAHYIKIFTIDKATGKVITLSELLKNDSTTLNNISQNIKEQMVKQMADNENILYFYDSDMPETDFKGLTGKESYYLNNHNQLVITFNEYEVAPGYMGAVEFTIPTEVYSLPTSSQ